MGSLVIIKYVIVGFHIFPLMKVPCGYPFTVTVVYVFVFSTVSNIVIIS